MGMTPTKPLVMDATKSGVSLTDPEWQNIFQLGDLHDGIKPDMDVVGAWAKESWTRRAVDVRAKALLSLPFAVRRIGQEEPVWTEATEPPPELAFFDHYEILYKMQASLCLVGAAYAMKEGTESGGKFRNVTGLKYINPVTTEPHFSLDRFGPDADGRFTHFKRSVNGRTFFIPREFMVSLFLPSPFVEQGKSTSDGEAARMHSQVLHDMAEFTSNQLRSGLVKKTIWMADKDTKPPQEDTIKKWQRWVRRNILGTRATPDDPVVFPGLKAQEIGSDLTSLHSKEITDNSREAVATAFGIPQSILMSNAANFATAERDVLTMLSMTTVPDARMLQRALNEQLFEDAGYRWTFEPERHEAFQASELAKAQSVSIVVGAPILTVNEGRELLGYGPMGGTVEQADGESKAADIRRWRTKTERAGRMATFVPDALSEQEEMAIKERLADATIPIEDVFRPPFR